ncbi:MAG TPA: DUF4010 domain-containing protein [Steroidobacteraceae bacterium]|nr:DUF4010 domain-containing protein [Steroidobacteraceae bacterium]
MLGQVSSIEVAGRLGLALAMAVFIGLAFEGVYKLDQSGNPGGIRTFPLLTTLGAVLFLLQPTSMLPFVVGLGAVAAWQYAHQRAALGDPQQRPSLMIPTASALAYALGPIALTQPSWVVLAASVSAVLLIESRESLHRLVHQIAPAEVFTLGKFLILIGVILPLAPNHPIVAWTPITPFKVWLALVATSTLSYASYLLQKYLPAHSNALLPAILGGIYSSTVTTVALARQQRAAGEARRDFAAGIVIATAIMYLRIGVVVAVFDWPLALLMLPALGSLALLGAAIALLEWARMPQQQPPMPMKELASANPLQLATALGFAAMFVVVAVLSSWARSSFGQRGVFVLAAITGMTDIDPFVLSLVQGGVSAMPMTALCAAILIAASSNNALKAAYALGFGGVRACRRPAAGLIILALAGIAAAIVYLKHSAS